MIETSELWVRLGAEDFDELVAGTGPSDAASIVEDALISVREPALKLTLTVSGPEIVLQHRIWVGEVAMALLLALDENRWQLMADDPEAMAAALFRATRTELVQEKAEEVIAYDEAGLPGLLAPDRVVRRAALDSAEAGSAWKLEVDDGNRLVPLWGTQGDAGTRLHDSDRGAFVTATNTDLYRVFSTIVVEFTQSASSL